MKTESGFLAKGDNSFGLDNNETFTGFQTLSASKTGFFCILIGKHLGRKVVIKTIKEEHADNPVAIAQLKKEFSILFPLDSPNVVHALSIIEFGGKIPAIEMEWCDGTDVREILNNRIALEDAVEIIRGVLGGLKDIHQMGILHRDIKPENVMYDPFRKVVKIIDFGCAYLTGALALQGPNGTPDYTPEDKIVVGSESEPKDDLYALGVMVAEMIENMGSGSKKNPSIVKRLRRFSDILIAGGYEKTENAIEAFEKIIRKRSGLWIFLFIAFPVILGIALFFLSRSLPTDHLSQETLSIETISDTILHDETPVVTDKPVQELPTSDITDSKAERKGTVSEVEVNPAIPSPYHPYGASLNPYSGISSEDESAYELAVAAGRLLQSAESSHATPEVKMDAFVVKFADSLYRAEGLQLKYPRHIEEEDRRVLAKKIADKYKNKMEQEFKKCFGNAGDKHRREVMFEGRWYCTLSAYHYNPYAKTASSGKSN